MLYISIHFIGMHPNDALLNWPKNSANLMSYLKKKKHSNNNNNCIPQNRMKRSVVV